MTLIRWSMILVQLESVWIEIREIDNLVFSNLKISILNKACSLQSWSNCKISKINHNKILACEMEVCHLLGTVMGLKVFYLNKAIKL